MGITLAGALIGSAILGAGTAAVGISQSRKAGKKQEQAQEQAAAKAAKERARLLQEDEDVLADTEAGRRRRQVGLSLIETGPLGVLGNVPTQRGKILGN